MIRPFDPADCQPLTRGDASYKITAWDNELPEFDPLPMFKTVLLSPNSVEKFNWFVVRFTPLLGPFIFVALALRYATFLVSAPVGRILSLVSAVLQIPGIVVTFAHMRTEYANIVVRTFDFCFLQIANTLWAITMCVVLRDLRIAVVFVCWINFACWLLHETYLRNSYLIVGVALWEWLFFAMLLLLLSLELVDEVEHYSLLTTRDHTISTKDVLANVIGTMAMLSLRNLYRRVWKYKKSKPGTATPALGYRCKIALSAVSTISTPLKCNILPRKVSKSSEVSNETNAPSTIVKLNKIPPLQMHLHVAAESTQFGAEKTVWPRIGALTPLSTWKLVLLYACESLGGMMAILSLFLPVDTYGAEVIAVAGFALSALCSGVYICCCQRQLIKRIMTTFHFWFLSVQVLTTGVCVMDIFSWRWIPVCGVVSSLLLGHTLLVVDGLTPIMKRRLWFKFWMATSSIGLLWVVHILLLLDLMVLNNWGLRDRVFMDFSFFGRRSTFHVAPFLLSRILTVFVWSGRYAYVVLTRQNDNALILLRGEVEFDYEGWKKNLALVTRKNQRL